MPKVKRISASSYWFFTWNNYDRVQWLQNLKSQLDTKCKMYIVEHEVGESGTEHLQGKIYLKAKGRPLELFGIKEIHWEKSKKWKGHEYCAKEADEEGVNIWFKGFQPILPPKIYGWQQEVVDALPDLQIRKIYWYWEPDGRVGKTDLCRYLVLRKNAFFVGGKAADMKCAIAMKKEKEGSFNHDLIVINIPRSSKDYVSYTGIEEVSDGLFFSGKYESGPCIINKVKIIVFANEEPKYHEMSLDRWIIKRIVV